MHKLFVLDLQILCNQHRNGDKRSKVRPSSAHPLTSHRDSSTSHVQVQNRLRFGHRDCSHKDSFLGYRSNEAVQDVAGSQTKSSHSRQGFPVSRPQHPKGSRNVHRSLYNEGFGNEHGKKMQSGKFLSQSFCDLGRKRKPVVYVAVPSGVY